MPFGQSGLSKRAAAGRILSYIAVAFGWLLFAVRVTLDLVGWSTFPEDIKVATTRASQIFDIISSVSISIIFIALSLLTALLIWYSFTHNNRKNFHNSEVITVDSNKKEFLKKPSLNIEEIYTQRIHLNFSKFWNEYYIEVAIMGFNGSESEISFAGIAGQIEYNIEIDKSKRIRLPQIVFLHSKSPNKIERKSPFMLVFEQRIPKDTLDHMISRLKYMPIELRYNNLNIKIRNETSEVFLALPAGTSIRTPKTGDLIFSDIFSATVSARIGSPQASVS